jgi:hypothetical protein
LPARLPQRRREDLAPVLHLDDRQSAPLHAGPEVASGTDHSADRGLELHALSRRLSTIQPPGLLTTLTKPQCPFAGLFAKLLAIRVEAGIRHSEGGLL